MDGEGNVIGKIPKRLLRLDLSHEVMKAFEQYLERKLLSKESTNESVKAMFDKAVAEVINKGTEFLKTSLVAAPELAKLDSDLESVATGTNSVAVEIPECADFWVALKKGTMLEDVNEDTVYLFLLKLFQGREGWKESMRGVDLRELDQLKQELESANQPYTADHLMQVQNGQVEKRRQFQGHTAHAIDVFTSIIQILTAIDRQVGNCLEVQYGGDTVAGMVEEAFEDARAALVQQQEEKVAFRDYEDELEDLGNLEGLDARELVRVGTIEEEDAYYAFRLETWDPDILYRLHKPTWFKTICGKEWIAKRAPLIASLLDGTRLPDMWYEKRLMARLLAHYKVNWDQLEANYAGAVAARNAENKALMDEVQASYRRDRVAKEVERESSLVQGAQGLSIGDSEAMDCEMD